MPIFDEDRSFYRPTTAPARPLSEIEEFRRSKEFYLLEQAVLCSAQLIHRSNQKYDLDSFEGQTSCKRYLKIIEKLQEVLCSHLLTGLSFFLQAFKAQTASRRYRTEFSRAYKILYKEGTLCYLTEILDSAQEGKMNW